MRGLIALTGGSADQTPTPREDGALFAAASFPRGGITVLPDGGSCSVRCPMDGLWTLTVACIVLTCVCTVLKGFASEVVLRRFDHSPSAPCAMALAPRSGKGRPRPEACRPQPVVLPGCRVIPTHRRSLRGLRGSITQLLGPFIRPESGGSGNLSSQTSGAADLLCTKAWVRYRRLSQEFQVVDETSLGQRSDFSTCRSSSR